jgi:hypothetical protein
MKDANLDEAMAAIDRLEQQRREETRPAETVTDVTPEEKHEQFAAELAARLNQTKSNWTTFGESA